ncbi:MAG TPA: BBE domain-containing protein [Capillimicrobium sp.]|nr:BBE domain-containing protein [Capillimicrobium sp.]
MPSLLADLERPANRPVRVLAGEVAAQRPLPRLRAIKQAVDPDGVFTFQQAI